MAQGGNTKLTLGRWGEEQAAHYIRGLGFNVLERNFFARVGELDIVAQRHGVLNFFEVKTRRNASHGTHESVTAGKRHRFACAVRVYLQRRRVPHDHPCQCGVITVVGFPGGPCVITLWYLSTFDLTWF